jgi:hypothetical protein
MGIGNENWGPQYVERLKIFTKAIKAKYPYIKLVNSSGTDPDGARFDYLNTELRNMNADIIDEHYYRRPEWFFANASAMIIIRVMVLKYSVESMQHKVTEQ